MGDSTFGQPSPVKVYFLLYKIFEMEMIVKIEVGRNGSWIEWDKIEYDF